MKRIIITPQTNGYLIQVLLLFLLLGGAYGCSSSGQATEAERVQQQDVTVGAENSELQPEANAHLPGNHNSENDPALSDNERQLMERELFSRYYAQYGQLYNEMIQEYFTAQNHLNNGNLSRARASAIRASNVLPNRASIELLLLVLERSGNEAEAQEWSQKLEELIALEEAGMRKSPNGTILRLP